MSTSLRSYTARLVLARPARRGFGVSAWRTSGKEDALHVEKEQRQETVEVKKSKGIKDKEWQSELASNSESIVKAERGEVKDSKAHIDELQKEASEIFNKKK